MSTAHSYYDGYWGLAGYRYQEDIFPQNALPVLESWYKDLIVYGFAKDINNSSLIIPEDIYNLIYKMTYIEINEYMNMRDLKIEEQQSKWSPFDGKQHCVSFYMNRAESCSKPTEIKQCTILQIIEDLSAKDALDRPSVI